MKIAMLLTGNNVSRIILMFGLPCSCIVMNSLQLYSPKHILQSLRKWERCLNFIMIKSVKDVNYNDESLSRSNSFTSTRESHASDAFHELSALHESSSSSQVSNIESSCTTLNDNISDDEIVSEQTRNREL